MAKKRITFSADSCDLELAKESAKGQNTTLSELFREWLQEVAARQEKAKQVREVMESLRHVNAGRKFTREEMNERR